MPESFVPIDQLAVTAIAVSVKALPQHTDVAGIYPRLYEHGFALLTDASGRLVRVVGSIQLIHDEPTMQDKDWVMLPYESWIDSARSIFEQSEQHMIPLVYEDGVYTGLCASKAEWMKLHTGKLELPRIGGLATPIGVYLTTGVYTAGAGNFGLVLTGIGFAILVTLARWGFDVLAQHYVLLKQANDLAHILGVFLLLLILIRLSPLSGLHAAEHQTIQAIEKGLPLTPENILQQPKAHHRCGTNMMVALIGLEMGYVGATSIQPFELSVLFLMLWLLLLIFGWHSVGMLIQTIFTTSRPQIYQLENAIKAGRELLEKFRARPHGNPSIWQRVWGTGLLQVMGSFAFTSWSFQQLLQYWINRHHY